MAWLMASPIRLMRRSMRNTPIGGAPRERARHPTSARRMKENSMNGAMTGAIMPVAAPAAPHRPRPAPGHTRARKKGGRRKGRAHQLDVVQRGKHGAPLAVPAQNELDEIG